MAVEWGKEWIVLTFQRYLFHSGPMHIWSKILIFILRTWRSKWRVLTKGPMGPDFIFSFGSAMGQVWMGAGQLLLTLSPCRIDAGGLGVSDTSGDVFEKNWRNWSNGITAPNHELHTGDERYSLGLTCFWHKQSDVDWWRNGEDNTSKGKREV